MASPREKTAGGTRAQPVLAQRLGYLLKRVNFLYQAHQAPALESFGIDGRLLAVMTAISADGPAPQQRLVERLTVDRTTMVAIIDKLEQEQLVTREPDPHDRRAHRISLTPHGENVRRQAQAAVDQNEQQFLRDLSAREQQQLRRLLQKVSETATTR